MSVPQEPVGERAQDLHGPLVRGGEVIGRNGPAATQLDRDLDRPVASHDPASPQLALDPVDVAPRQPGVRRAQVRVERGPLAGEPREPEEREQ